jgi:hypothetical protein
MMRRAAGLFLTGSIAIHVALAGTMWLVSRGHGASRSDPNATFAGETFDIAPPADQRPAEVEPVVADRSDPNDLQTDQAEVARPRPRAPVRGGRNASTAHEVEPLTYGALGDRSASDVTVSLARGFPQAASTDPIWRDAAFGDAGSATLEIELAPDGSLARWNLGTGASPALRQAMVRTMAFIGGRSFLARSAITKLHITARVTADAVRDGTDAVYAIHSEHEADHASGYFSLSSGRRIDVVITPAK